MLISNLIFVLKSHCRKFKITNGLIDKSPYSPFKIDMSQQDNDFEEPKFTLKILKYVTTEKMALLVTCYIHPTWYVLPSLGSSTEELNNNKCRQNVFLCFISSFYMVHEALMFTVSIHNNCFHYFDTKDPLLLRFISVGQVKIAVYVVNSHSAVHGVV